MAEKYSYTIGRRKTSIASLRLYRSAGQNTINSKATDKIYGLDHDMKNLMSPFKTAELDPKDYYFTVRAVGGGKYSQLDAIKLALARAITSLYPEKKKVLKDGGFLTRDPRMVERKKAGLRKARKSEQYSKR